MKIQNEVNREHLANFRKGKRRIDLYIEPSNIEYLEFFEARHPGASVSAIINGVIKFAYQKISGNAQAVKW